MKSFESKMTFRTWDSDINPLAYFHKYKHPWKLFSDHFSWVGA